MKTAKEILIARSLIPKGASIHDNSIVLFKEALEAMEEYHAQFEENYDLKKLYDWLMDEKRGKAITHFTSGIARNIASEIEFRLFSVKPEKHSPDEEYNKAVILEMCSKVEKYQGNLNFIVPEGTAFCGSKNTFGRCTGCGEQIVGEVHCYLLPARIKWNCNL